MDRKRGRSKVGRNNLRKENGVYKIEKIKKLIGKSDAYQKLGNIGIEIKVKFNERVYQITGIEMPGQAGQ